MWNLNKFINASEWTNDYVYNNIKYVIFLY